MKRLINLIIIILFLAACKEKNMVSQPLPDASFNFKENDDNTVTFNFIVNNGDVYTLDFGDGSKRTDSLIITEKNKTLQVGHSYKTNGKFTAILKIENKIGSDQKQLTVEVQKNLTSDFSYEIGDSGKVKFKNLSQNATGYKWSIEHFNASNYVEFYISNEKDPEVSLDLAGSYFVKLITNKGDFTSTVKKLITVKTAKNQMEFTGYYKGEKIDGNIESKNLSYRYGFGSDGSNFNLFQRVYSATTQNDSLQLVNQLDGIFYPILPYNSASVPTQEETYISLKKYLTTGNNPNIIEVMEESLNPKLYNNIDKFYPKAFWIKYKIKNDVLDGVIKVRVIVPGAKSKL